MNLINATLIQNFSNWVDSTPITQVIDTVTYDVYEADNPFRRTFDKNDIKDDKLRLAANTTSTVSAEVFSAFSNPYYLTHKITQIPSLYKSVADVYKKYSQNKQD